MLCDQVQLEDGCLHNIQQLPHDTAAVNWKLSERLPTEQLEREQPEDNLIDLGTRLGSAGKAKSRYVGACVLLDRVHQSMHESQNFQSDELGE